MISELENLKPDFTKNSVIDGWPGEIWIKDVIHDLKKNKYSNVSKETLLLQSKAMIEKNQIITKSIFPVIKRILNKLNNQKDINDFYRNYKSYDFKIFSIDNYDAKNLRDFAHTISKNNKGIFFENVKQELDEIEGLYNFYLECKNIISKNRVFLYYFNFVKN